VHIEVHLFATLREGRFRRKTLELPAGSNVGDICLQLAIGAGEVAIVTVNGSAALRDCALNAGDEVSLFPAMGGG
jgi:molybdopterin converting factor small subunit